MIAGAVNYRHAFHAGNFADVLKHSLVARILAYLIEKPGPVRYIDTHAGVGRYDLAGSEASRTGEWSLGIGRILRTAHPEPVRTLLAPYLAAVGPPRADGRPAHYPGSPALAQHILRPADRLLLCELHPADQAALRANVKGDKRVKVLAADGYAQLKASVPPPERRGLVLIDPPYEERNEFNRVLSAFTDAYRRWPTGTYALWYPIKTGAPAAAFLAALHALELPKTLEAELATDRPPAHEGGLRGSGLFVANPPFTLREDAELLLPHLAACLGQDDAAWRWRVDGATR